MEDKQVTLERLRQAINAGVISQAEVWSLLDETRGEQRDAAIKKPGPSAKLSAVDVMFHVAGIIMFVSIMSLIGQTWESGSPIVHILLSAGVGSGLWSLAHYLSKSAVISEIRRGLINAIILTGSLSVIAGGFIITNELIGGFGEVNFVPAAVTFAVLGAVHMIYARLVRSHLMLMLSAFLSVATFPALIFGLLEGSAVPADVWALVVIVSAALLAYASRVVARLASRTDTERKETGQAFDSLAIIVALVTMFFSSFTEYGILWTMLMILSVFALFYVSIITRQKRMLGNASFFLVVAVLTISFKYFSGAGVTVSLAVATLGLLGSAAVASGINKKYFKEVKE